MTVRTFFSRWHRLVAAAFLLGGLLVAAPAPAAATTAVPDTHAQPSFGPNVIVFQPSMSQATIQSTLDAIATQQVPNQFGPQRYAIFFQPGTYGSVASPLVFQLGYYTQVAGLGAAPGDVVINGAIDVFNQCFGGDAASCALVHRAPGTGSLWLGNQGFVILTNQNFKGLGLYTKGIDVSGAYNRRIGGMGTLNASFVGTYLMKLATPGATGNAVGRFSGSTPSPKWRHKLRLGFTLPDGLGISGQWRHFSAVHCRAIIGGLPADAGCQAKFHGVIYQRPGNLQLNQANFFDLALTARVTQKFNLRIGANNILDTAPPVAGGEVIPAGFGNGNTYPQVYDSLGRYIFAGVTLDF